MRTFCITCRESGRKEDAAKHFAERGLAVEWWEGVWQTRKDAEAIFDPGCNASHRTLWQALQIGGIEEALILEDDALLCRDFAAHLEAFRNTLPDSWQMAWLGYLRSGDEAHGTHCYAVKASALPALIEANIKPKFGVDVQISRLAMTKLQTHFACPVLAIQRDWIAKGFAEARGWEG